MLDLNNQQEVTKRFQSSFVLILISQFLFLFASLSVASKFKFPGSDWLGLLILFNYIAYIVMGIGLFRIRNINQNLKYALYTFIILIVVNIFQDVCAKSNDDFYIVWSKALSWSGRFLLGVLYVYLFLGFRDFFFARDLARPSRNSKRSGIAFLSLFVVERLAVFLMFFDGIKSNMIANRVCTYLSWVMVIVIYIYVIVALFIILVNMKRKYERKENGTEAKENA